MKIEDVIIIGAGPAGLSCALQLSRYGIRPLILEKDEIGGLLRNANLVENYLGFPGGITGKELVKLFHEQILKYSVRINREEVVRIDFENGLFITDANTNYYSSRFLVLASGTLPKFPADVVINNDAKDNIFFDVLQIINCENKNIIIAGAGDLAFDYTLNLGKKNKIILVNRSEIIKCIPLLIERAKKLDYFRYMENTVINRISKKGDNLLVEYKKDYLISSLCADYVVFAIGRQSNKKLLTGKFKDKVDFINEIKYFEIGDVKNGSFRHTSIASGDGIKAAMKIYKILNEE